ncbi:MAG: YeeE/YedE family protein [Cyclobacteriaceae bacterium]|nr:YeeE/YedE family protein [Cyclobacteriaceae bacterium]
MKLNPENTSQVEGPVLQFPEECEAPNNTLVKESLVGSNIKYLLLGSFFGIILTKAEIISWYRMQEMFRLQSFHMYGLIGSAVVVGITSVWLIKKFQIKTVYGEVVVFTRRTFSWGQVIGGTLFGCGWAITGACPGPLFAQLGSGFLAVSVTILSAIAGTWVYGRFSHRLPH